MVSSSRPKFSIQVSYLHMFIHKFFIYLLALSAMSAFHILENMNGDDHSMPHSFYPIALALVENFSLWWEFS
uniref:Uncharacterized protein n=1 Tax=Rhizophora mucronata TaxID=61149 RepID=A0A2P2QYP0_RHIMU